MAKKAFMTNEDRKEAGKLKKLEAKRDTKTHHQTGYHKPVKNPTTNYPMDTHKAFCKRCRTYNVFCPVGNVHACSI